MTYRELTVFGWFGTVIGNRGLLPVAVASGGPKAAPRGARRIATEAAKNPVGVVEISLRLHNFSSFPEG